MPHKKAKLSARVQDRQQKGNDWAPGKDSIANEAIPKSASRILDAVRIREEFRAKKRKLEEEGDRQKGAKRSKKAGDSSLKIQPGESIQHFNRRVEDDLRPLVKNAIETGRAQVRSAVREEKEKKKSKSQSQRSKSPSKEEPAPSKPKPTAPKPTAAPQQSKHADKPKEFAPVGNTAPKRLNDIAMAPPELNVLPRMNKKVTGPAKSESVVSMAQKAMMEKERLGAIARYRELKARRSAAAATTLASKS